MARLGDICMIQSGGTPSRSQLDYWNGGTIPWVKISDFDGKYLHATEERITENGIKCSSAKLFRKGTVLYTIFATLGEVSILDIDATTNQAIAGLTILDDAVETDYLYYFLCSLKDYVNRIGRGVAQNNINLSILRNIEIPIPTHDKQKEIVQKLDSVSELIQHNRQQLSKLDDLVKSRFIELFGDLANPMCPHPQCRLVDACVEPDDIKCDPFGTQLSKDEYQQEGVAVWEIPHINSGFAIQPTHYLTPQKAKELSAYTLEPGDIAMSRKGNVGKCGLYPAGYEIGIIHSDVLRIRVDHQRVHPCFMMHQLHYSGAIQKQIEMVSSGAVMAGINVTKLKQIVVHIPDYSLQNQFSAFVEQTDKLKLAVKESLGKLEILKKSLMQEYFG